MTDHLREATDAGTLAGTAAADWTDDGTMSVGTARAILDGDPAALDAFSPDVSPADIAAAVDLDNLPPAQRDAAEDRYIDAFQQAYAARLDTIAAGVVQAADHLAASAPFERGDTVSDGRGIALHVLGPPTPDAPDMVPVRMVGDDRDTFRDVAELRPLDDGDHCAGCGQEGCRHG